MSPTLMPTICGQCGAPVAPRTAATCDHCHMGAWLHPGCTEAHRADHDAGAQDIDTPPCHDQAHATDAYKLGYAQGYLEALAADQARANFGTNRPRLAEVLAVVRGATCLCQIDHHNVARDAR